ncbi:hypothetical protein H920_07354 [Fukomys damarensis]|uniref:Uncharacterized protein n=1 Tax=Fukomys damarensis TaxID=885580 RepID=A0A091DJK8_FUKDA|nr:hypothetical protein H920_07354 [Fukomys damarensis]
MQAQKRSEEADQGAPQVCLIHGQAPERTQTQSEELQTLLGTEIWDDRSISCLQAETEALEAQKASLGTGREGSQGPAGLPGRPAKGQQDWELDSEIGAYCGLLEGKEHSRSLTPWLPRKAECTLHEEDRDCTRKLV